MSTGWRLLEYALLSAFVLSMALALLTSLLQPWIDRAAADLDARKRARIYWWLLVAPALTGLLQVMAILAMSAASRTFPALQSVCASHSGSWWHACVWHPLESTGNPWLWLAMVVVLGGLGLLAVRSLCALFRAQQQFRALIRLARQATVPGDVRVLESPIPLALAVGLRRGHVLISKGLTTALSAAELDAVIAHEKAHLANGDIRDGILARVASLLHLPRTRACLLGSWTLATEQRCDQAAALSSGSPLVVAQALLAVERAQKGQSRPLQPLLTIAFAESFLTLRVQALLQPGVHSQLPLGPMLLAMAALFIFLTAGWVHHITEFVLLFVPS